MDVERAIETEIEPKLRDAFDFSTTKSLLTMGTLAYVTTVGPELQRYRALVDSICTDERVVNKWGAGTAARQSQEWKDLFPEEHKKVVVLTPKAP